MASTDYTLKYQIDADSSKAVASLKQVEERLKKAGAQGGTSAEDIQKGFKKAAGQVSEFVAILTGNKLTGATSQITSFSSAISSIPGPAGLAIGAVVGFSAVAIAGGAALFGLTKAAADYGSIIHDAGQKTGLSAETISSLKYAADISGASIENIETGLGRFAKTVGAAGEGSKEAEAKIKSLGIEPKAALNDLDGALGKVFKRIYDAKPGIEQVTLAQKAFGKSGADLIPTIIETGGNLDALKKKAKELGISINDEAADAADKFGDELDTLKMQIEAVGRTIGFALMPEFLDMATEISGWLKDNPDAIKSWGDTFVTALKTVQNAVKLLILDFKIADEWSSHLMNTPKYYQMLNDREVLVAKDNNFWSGNSIPSAGKNLSADGEEVMPGGILLHPPTPTLKKTYGDSDFDKTGGGSGKIHRAPAESDAAFRKFFEDEGFKVNRTFGGAINAGSPHPFGGAADVSIAGKTAEDIFRLMSKALEKGYRVFDERQPAPGVKQTGPHIHVENAKTSLTKDSRILGLGFSPDQLAYLQNLDKERLGKASGTTGLNAFVKKQTDEQKRLQDEAAKNFEAAEARKLQIGQTVTESLIELQQQEFESGLKYSSSPELYAAADKIHELRMSQSNDEITAMEEKLSRTVAGSEEEKQLVDEINLKKIRAAQSERKSLEDIDKLKQQIFERDLKRAADLLDKQLADAEKLYQDSLIHMQKAGVTPGLDKDGNPTTFIGKDGMPTNQAPKQRSSLGQHIDDLMSRMNAVKDMKASLQELGHIGVDAFEGMAGAVGSAIEQWAMYGGSVGQALKQALSAELAHIAGVATVNALYATALGFMRLAEWDFAGAASAFTSAGMWALLAGGSALGARALAPKKDAGSKSASAAGYASGSSTASTANQTPYSRVSNTAFNSGSDKATQNLSDAVDRLHAKIASMSPGEILTVGARAKRGFISEQAIDEIRADSGKANKLNRSIGNL